MIVYTTCRRCGGLLHTTDGDSVHPGCDPKPTKVERLAQQWLDAVQADDEERQKELFPQIEELDTRQPRMLEAALQYAEWGWPVFPLREVGGRCDGEKKCTDAGICQCPKKPATRNGFKDATTDPGQIRTWWTQLPQANIGLPTGMKFDVIDFDIPDGIPTLGRLTCEDRAVHGQAVTWSGGTHLYIKPTGRGNHTRWLPGTDYRGKGGYVVAPPSWLGRRGTSWSWLHTPSPIITGAGDTYGVQ